jgi:soluble lytic murein transglycosylase
LAIQKLQTLQVVLHLHRLLFAGLLFSGAALASIDKDFLAARDAFAKKDLVQLERLAARIPAQHPLGVYFAYWQLSGRSSTAAEWLAFADAHPDTPLSERARQEAARFYGALEDWSALRQVTARLVKPDRELQCLDLRARLHLRQPGVTTEALVIWRTAQDLPSSCDRLFTDLTLQGVLTASHRLERLRLALEAGNLRQASSLLASMPNQERPDGELLSLAQKAPEKVIAAGFSRAADREIQLYALSRLAKNNPERAAQIWDDRTEQLPAAYAQHGWGVIALAAARLQMPEAVAWYLRAQNHLSDTQRLWGIRTMLRAGRWNDVHQGILGLPPAIQNEAVWRYWKGRALQAMNNTYQANQLFAQLSREFHYYGLMAYEELPVRMETRQEEYRPTPESLQAAEAHAGLARALLLRKNGMDSDAFAEWEWALRGMSDVQLLAAADLARKAGWYDRAINTAEKTKEIHSFDLRYLTPYRDLAESHAKSKGLDPAWVYGLIRQESRFIHHARSRVGAQGLMQIMPATARWIAQQLGMSKKTPLRMNEPEDNIRFGTFYLKNLSDSLNGSAVLATAGYNAGPGRARKWQADTDLEGAIYVESIPFVETREYVKKVMANAMHYSRRLGLPSRSLKERLGTVPARAVSTASSKQDRLDS